MLVDVVPRFYGNQYVGHTGYTRQVAWSFILYWYLRYRENSSFPCIYRRDENKLGSGQYFILP